MPGPRSAVRLWMRSHQIATDHGQIMAGLHATTDLCCDLGHGVAFCFPRDAMWHHVEPGVPLTNFNDGGGSYRGSLFIPKKNHNFRMSTQKIPTFFSIPKKSFSPFFVTKKNPSVFFVTQKNPGIFHRPKKSLWAKISDPKKSLGLSHH